MSMEEDLSAGYEARFASLGYELVDLGRDFESESHLYSLFDDSTGELVSDKLMNIEDAEAFLDILEHAHV